MTRDVSVLRLSGLRRSFGDRVAVNDLTLEVRQGDLYGFLGPNGSGKTTAIRCILGLIARDRGEVEICGQRDPVLQRQEVGAMIETPRFHDWLSAAENLRVACAYAGRGGAQDVALALERVGLAARAEEPVRGFSLGMRQRLGIARAIVARPRLLILDEPTNGLDPRGMKEIRELLVELVRNDGLTVFVSSHLLAEVEQMCNRVAILDGGRLISEGTVDALKRQSLDVASGDGSAPEAERPALVDLAATPADAARAHLASLPTVRLLTGAPPGRLRLALTGLTPAQLNRDLVRAGIDVDALVPVDGSLEDVYLASTRQEASIL